MSLNNYDLCPCGSGKKIKFCKCSEHLAEMDKIVRMIEGEQFVAALDQINSQLKLLPSEPWLLALKCDVLMRLGEGEALEETSAKFIRLQPDNPLAKLNRAMVAMMRGAADEAANLYLQAISTQNVTVNSLLLTVLTNLVQFLADYNQPLSAYLHLELATDEFDGIEQYTYPILAKLLQNNQINLLGRDSIPSPPSRDDASYAERYREAIVMMRNADVSHAKTKLEGIQREFGADSAILIALLHCKLYLVDPMGAAETCVRLAADQSLDDAQRAYFFALAIELDANKTAIVAKNRVVEYRVENESELETTLSANSRLTVLRDEQVKTFIQQLTREEVPPRMVCDVRMPVGRDKFAELNPTLSIGLVALFGKETDKPARLLMIYAEGLLADRDAFLHQIPVELGVDTSSPLRDDVTPVPYLNIANAAVTIKNEALEGKDIPEEELSDFVQSVRMEALQASKYPAFNGKTLAEAASDPAYKTEATGLLLHYMGSSQTGLELGDYKQLHQSLGLAFPNCSGIVDGFDHVGAAYYYWADLATIEPNELLGLIRSAMQRQHVEVFRAYLDALNSKQFADDMQIEISLLKKQLTLSLTRTPQERLEKLQEYYEALRESGKPAGSVGIAWFQLLSQLGMHQPASETLRRVVSENQNDPAVREFVYMLNMQIEQMRQQQAANPLDGSTVQEGLFRRAASQQTKRQGSEGGLWTPDQGSPAASPSSESSGGSGLWIPGQ